MTTKQKSMLGVAFGMAVMLFLSQCAQAPKENETAAMSDSMKTPDYGGYDSQVKWGEHLVIIGGCGDCHTPKKMTDHGPVQDSSLLLSGHPSAMPAPPIDRKEVEGKGLAVTQTLTAWVGPWGVSYAANLTPDPTGLGNWKEADFFTAIRHGKFNGMETSRPLMPPMPWESIRLMTDNELKAVFAYLQSIKPILNVVPEYQPPVMAQKH